jgi:uncharacterized protein (TIGR02246 family)
MKISALKTLPLIVAATFYTLSSQAESTFKPIHEETHHNMNCVKVSEEEIAALFDRWNASLATLDPNLVAVQYAHDAILLPTVSNKMRTNHEEIKDYFSHFLLKKPHGKIEKRTISIGCNTASDTGIYVFTLHENGKMKKVEARYSFVYEYDDDQWLIEHHHSSMMPEKKPHQLHFAHHHQHHHG